MLKPNIHVRRIGAVPRWIWTVIGSHCDRGSVGLLFCLFEVEERARTSSGLERETNTFRKNEAFIQYVTSVSNHCLRRVHMILSSLTKNHIDSKMIDPYVRVLKKR